MKIKNKYYPISHAEISPLVDTGKTILFFDTASPAAGGRFSFLFINPSKVLCAENPGQINGLLQNIDKLSKKYWLSGYLSYEASYAQEAKLNKLIKTLPGSPAGWFGVFEKPYIFDHNLGMWNRPLPKPGKVVCRGKITSPVFDKLNPSIGRNDYEKKLSIIKRSISKGDTYQINYTFDVSAGSRMKPFDIYLQLRKNQPTSYCAYVQNGHGYVLSFSPELFFEKKGKYIVTKPMKGTSGRGYSPDNDVFKKKQLGESNKNKAENLMIVDLLRNDLGRICEIGSVRVKKLFEVETYPTIHQMTSTIGGKLLSDTGISDIVKCLFPCGSVTGAPKISSMEIISKLENGPRGIYCGMLGYVSPLGDAVFSVPIRTLQKEKMKDDWRYRVGSGIVWNSKAGSEWDECMSKCSFLQGINISQYGQFEIFESILWNGMFLYWKDHLLRMKNSAKVLGYSFPNERIKKAVEEIKIHLDGKKNIKVRIFLDKKGAFRWDSTVLGKPAGNGIMKVCLKKTPVDEQEVMLYHKTTYRPWYEEAMKKIKTGRCFDEIFLNSRGELTEGAISNVFIRKNGRLYTPPVRCGLLGGILRKKLIESGKCTEKTLFPEDLKTAEKVYCGNSVRGLVEVKVQ